MLIWTAIFTAVIPPLDVQNFNTNILIGFTDYPCYLFMDVILAEVLNSPHDSHFTNSVFVCRIDSDYWNFLPRAHAYNIKEQ